MRTESRVTQMWGPAARPSGDAEEEREGGSTGAVPPNSGPAARCAEVTVQRQVLVGRKGALSEGRQSGEKVDPGPPKPSLKILLSHDRF